jgi:hypothetical protein
MLMSSYKNPSEGRNLTLTIKMIIICPGIHDSELTDRLVKLLQEAQIHRDRLIIYPTQNYPAFSAFHLERFLQQKLSQSSDRTVIFLSFSAGVVGAIGAALAWQQNGGKVAAFIALDGWGVPLWGDFPIYRFSHDEFTHWSSALLGSGKESFYADPPVEHLTLWRSPDLVGGWKIKEAADGYQIRSYTTAIATLKEILEKEEGSLALGKRRDAGWGDG